MKLHTYHFFKRLGKHNLRTLAKEPLVALFKMCHHPWRPFNINKMLCVRHMAKTSELQPIPLSICTFTTSNNKVKFYYICILGRQFFSNCLANWVPFYVLGGI